MKTPLFEATNGTLWPTADAAHRAMPHIHDSLFPDEAEPGDLVRFPDGAIWCFMPVAPDVLVYDWGQTHPAGTLPPTERPC